MITLEKLESYITDDILNELFLEREDKIHDMENIEEQEKIFENDRKCNEKLRIALENLPECFEETSKEIKKCVEEKVKSQNEILAFLYEKFYKVGFGDGISLILESLNTKNQI